MMNSDDTNSRRFLLGDMSAGEREAFETRFLTDESLFQQLSLVEGELIEHYILDALTDSDKAKFEGQYLSNPIRRQRVEVARATINRLNVRPVVAENSLGLLAAVGRMFAAYKLSFVALAVLTALGVGIWLIVIRRPSRDDIALLPAGPQHANVSFGNQSVSTIPDQTDDPANANKLPTPMPQLPTPSPPPPTSKASERILTPTIALSAGVVRSGGPIARLVLPKNAMRAQINLRLESVDYKIYSAEIVDQNGGVIFGSQGLSPRGKSIVLLPSATALKSGDYIVKLRGKNVKGQDEAVEDYQFRVEEK